MFQSTVSGASSSKAPSPVNTSIPLTLSTANRRKSTDGVLSITTARWKARVYFRAVLTVNGEKKRRYGTRNEEAVVSASNLFTHIPHHISKAETNRVLETVRGFQPSGPPNVSMIHQIYGMHRDGKPMSKTFENSLQRWRQLAKQILRQASPVVRR